MQLLSVAGTRRKTEDAYGSDSLVCRDRGVRAHLVEARAGAHPARTGEIDHQHAHRTVGLRLEDEAAVELERGAEQHREHDRLAQQLGDRWRIVVARKNLVERAVETHDAAAQVEASDLERQDRVLDREIVIALVLHQVGSRKQP